MDAGFAVCSRDRVYTSRMARTPVTTFRLTDDERAAADRIAQAAACTRAAVVRAGIGALAEQDIETVRLRVAQVTGKAARPQG